MATQRWDDFGVSGMIEDEEGEFVCWADVLVLDDFSPGALEHLLRVIEGDRYSWSRWDSRTDRMEEMVKGELDARYTRIEEEVPGWRR